MTTTRRCNIKVVAVGTGGAKIIDEMLRGQVVGLDFLEIDAGSSSLGYSEAPVKIRLKNNHTTQSGCRGDYDFAARAAEESHDEIKKGLSGADIVIIVAGLGGGTGTGASPVVAGIARECGALSVALVTKPYRLEGQEHAMAAEEGIGRLSKEADATVILSKDGMLDTFCLDNDCSGNATPDFILCNAVRAFSGMVLMPGLLGFDFSDFSSAMKDAGPGWLSVGTGSGRGRVEEAIDMAISSPMVETPLCNAGGILFWVTSGRNLAATELEAAAHRVKEFVSPNAAVRYFVVYDDKMEDSCYLNLIINRFPTTRLATGFASLPAHGAERCFMARGPG